MALESLGSRLDKISSMTYNLHALLDITFIQPHLSVLESGVLDSMRFLVLCNLHTLDIVRPLIDLIFGFLNSGFWTQATLISILSNSIINRDRANPNPRVCKGRIQNLITHRGRRFVCWRQH